MEKKISVVAAPIIVNEEGKILYFKSVKWKGLVPPGGHIEYGETMEETVIRETKEETGLEIEPIEIINFGEMIEPPEFYEPRHLIYFHFFVRKTQIA